MKSDMKMTIEVDSSQLDEALRKMSLMLDLQDRIGDKGDLGLAVAAVAVGVAACPRRISRRSLLMLGCWKD